ncbi:MAG: lipid-A-disaccharide synthase [Cyclobacteriaceae bacterium]
MKYYLVAGERSGDLHGSNLIRSLQALDSEAEFRGIGGRQMQEAGLTIVIEYTKLAFMGFWEVFTNIFTIKRYLKQTRQDILDYKPDVLVLIDYPGFNMRLARFAHENGLRVYYYISPKIWAWNTKRAFKIKKWVDRMFTILPFEKGFYKQYQVDVDYVGNPVCDAIDNFSFENGFAKNREIAPESTIAVLPGSRRQEVRSFVPQIVDIAASMPEYVFTVSKVDNLPHELYWPLKNCDNVKVIEGYTYDILKNSSAAIVTSGTATLETAVLGVPQVVCYKTSKLTYWIAKKLIKVPYISLVNLIMEKEVVRELIQDELNTKNLKAELKTMVENPTQRTNMISAYDQLKEKLGRWNASDKAANLMYGYLKSGG